MVRITHWVNAAAFAALLVSGIAILISHPRLYWGETGNWETPSLIDLPLPFILGVYPGFPTLFWGPSGFFVGDLMGKALWKLVENAQRFPRRGGRVLCVHGAVSFHTARPCATRWLPGRGAMRDVELDRRVLGLQSTGE